MVKSDRRLWLIAAIAALGLGLMLVGGSARAEPTSAQPADWQSYTAALEQKAAELCSRVAGVEEVTVAVSLAQGVEHVYAEGDSRAAVLLTERPPQLSGIGVVCVGGDDPETVQTLLALLSAAFGIGTNRIYITGAD